MNPNPSRLLAVLLLLASFCVSCSKTDNPRNAEEARKDEEYKNPEDQFNLGNVYATGEIGVGKDLVKAVKWYRKAEEQGNAKSQCDLGLAYHNGKGVDKDLLEAYAWNNLTAVPYKDAKKSSHR